MAFTFEGGVFVITSQVFGDNRGYFMECYHRSDFAEMKGKRGLNNMK